MTVKLNNSYATTAAQRRAIVFHEEGHVTGIFADTLSSATSCMNVNRSYGYPTLPNAHDYNSIVATYNY